MCINLKNSITVGAFKVLLKLRLPFTVPLLAVSCDNPANIMREGMLMEIPQWFTMTRPTLWIRLGYAFIADSGPFHWCQPTFSHLSSNLRIEFFENAKAPPMRRCEVLALVSFMGRSVPALSHGRSIKSVCLGKSYQIDWLFPNLPDKFLFLSEIFLF